MLTRKNSRFSPPSTKASTYSRRRGKPRAPQLARPDYPFAMKIPDGRTLLLNIPGRWTTEDRDGSTLLLPEAVRFLDRIQALITPGKIPFTPGYLSTLREALDLTQSEFAHEIGVAKMTVSRWERGELRPGPDSLAKIDKLRTKRLAKGVILAG